MDGRPANRPDNSWYGSSKQQDFHRDQNVHYLFEASCRVVDAPRLPGREISDGGDLLPTPERRAQGHIEAVDRPIPDRLGRPGRPYRAVDTLAAMERRGTITAGMRQAGEDFRACFATAQLDPLCAFDISRIRTGRGCGLRIADAPGSRIEQAREAVWRAILAVGGLGSAGGSCVWHVLGWERSLKEWALEQGWNGRRISQEAASGILVAALGTLESHFGKRRR